jgi:outer membrane protein TolC
MSSYISSRQAKHPQWSRFRCWLALSALAAALGHASAVAAEIPLTLAQAQQIALGRSRQLAAQDFSIAAARDMAVAAGQLPDPILKFGIENLPIEGPDRFSVQSEAMTMRRIGVMQEFPRSEKRRLRAERFEREAEQSRAEKSAASAAILRDSALAWLDRYYAEMTATLLAEQSALARLEIDAAESAYRAGRGAQADIFAARSALAGLADRSSDNQRRLRNATTMLERWIGPVANAPLAGKPGIDVLPLAPTKLDQQLAHHPQIALLARQEERAETEVKLAEANLQSDWSVELAYQQRGSAFDNMISVGISVPLQWDRPNRQGRELSARLAQLEQAKAQREDALRAHVAEVGAMLNEWNSGRERGSRYQRELIPLAAERTQSLLAAYRGGKSGLAEVLAARRAESEVRMQALQLELEIARLWAQLNFLYPEENPSAHQNTHLTKDAK